MIVRHYLGCQPVQCAVEARRVTEDVTVNGLAYAAGFHGHQAKAVVIIKPDRQYELYAATPTFIVQHEYPVGAVWADHSGLAGAVFVA